MEARTIAIIETDRLLIREYVPEDLVQLYAILSDPATMSFWPAPFTLEQVDDWIELNLDRYELHGFGRWAIILKDMQWLIGDCGIVRTEIDGQEENDLGYIIHMPFWNEGYATEAAIACRDYAFDELGMDRLCANMPTTHITSRRIAEKLGMTLEKEFFNPRNRNLATCLYSVAKETV